MICSTHIKKNKSDKYKKHDDFLAPIIILSKMKFDKRNIFINGKNVYLKVLTKDDVIKSGWYGWFNDELTCETLQKH